MDNLDELAAEADMYDDASYDPDTSEDEELEYDSDSNEDEEYDSGSDGGDDEHDSNDDDDNDDDDDDDDNESLSGSLVEQPDPRTESGETPGVDNTEDLELDVASTGVRSEPGENNHETKL